MKKVQKIIDITLLIYSGMPVYPKNPEVLIEKIEEKLISKLTLGSHTGTHFDAPAHAFKNSKGIDTLKLENCIGPCRVLDMTHKKESVSANDLKKHNIKKNDRILLKTKNSLQGFKTFNENFIYLEGEAAEYLARQKIALIAIDYLSIKKRGFPDNRAHTEFLKRNIPIIEAINLKNVKPGTYTLIALPLKIKNCDGSPARVVLLK